MKKRERRWRGWGAQGGEGVSECVTIDVGNSMWNYVIWKAAYEPLFVSSSLNVCKWRTFALAFYCSLIVRSLMCASDCILPGIWKCRLSTQVCALGIAVCPRASIVDITGSRSCFVFVISMQLCSKDELPFTREKNFFLPVSGANLPPG